jgi:peptide-methionine (S)-S-oxide reductase
MGTKGMEKATFGAGCFWGVGGAVVEPPYRQVCTDTTGHAEVVELSYDPAKVSYDRLLDGFFANHDPTTLNRQGPDSGSQYRSVVLAQSPDQDAKTRAELETPQKAKRFRRPAIEPFGNFCRAEEYHQRYFEKNGLASCHVTLPEP